MLGVNTVSQTAGILVQNVFVRQGPLVRAQNYRVRAEELRSIRETWKDPETREILGKVAADYDRMADQLEMIASEQKTRGD